MNTNEAFLQALGHEKIKNRYPASSIRTWRSRAIHNKLSLDFMVEFLSQNGYKIKQTMLWHPLDESQHVANGKFVSVRNWDDIPHEKDYKSQLSEKLYAVRKQLNAELYNSWYEWSRLEYSKDFCQKNAVLTPVVFSQMTYGRYISKQNIPFAVKILKEGTRILNEYSEFIKREVESL